MHAAALLVLSSLGAALGPEFVRDDYPRALAEAKARKLPLFVEVWAPW